MFPLRIIRDSVCQHFTKDGSMGYIGSISVFSRPKQYITIIIKIGTVQTGERKNQGSRSERSGRRNHRLPVLPFSLLEEDDRPVPGCAVCAAQDSRLDGIERVIYSGLGFISARLIADLSFQITRSIFNV